MRSIVGGAARAAPPQVQPRLDLQAAAGCFSVKLTNVNQPISVVSDWPDGGSPQSLTHLSLCQSLCVPLDRLGSAEAAVSGSDRGSVLLRVFGVLGCGHRSLLNPRCRRCSLAPSAAVSWHAHARARTHVGFTLSQRPVWTHSNECDASHTHDQRRWCYLPNSTSAEEDKVT